MKKMFEELEIEILAFANGDVITASGDPNDPDDLGNGGGED